MSLEIHERKREGVTIFDLGGRITVGPEATLLRERIREAAEAGGRDFILNLADVDYIDSTGLGALVICYTSLRKQDRRLKLENLTRRSLELLIITKLTTVFEIFNDEQDAVNSFFPDREIKRFDILSFVKDQGGE